MTSIDLNTQIYHLRGSFGSADLIVAEESADFEFNDDDERVNAYALTWWIDGLESIDTEYFDTEAEALARMAELAPLNEWIDAAEVE